MGRILILDCETTGTNNHPKHGHPQTIELAYLSVKDDLTDFSNIIQKEYVEKFMPSMAIHPEAAKIHGYKSKDLIGCRKSEEIEIPKETRYIIGHNVQYDYRCLGKPHPETIKLICTMGLSKKLKKFKKWEYENHKLYSLIKFHYPEKIEHHLTEKHSALNDCLLCLMYLQKIVEVFPKITNFDELYGFQESLKG